MIQRWLGKQLRQPAGLFSKFIGLYMQRGNEAINRWTVDLMDLAKTDVLLEVGIGNGSTLNRIVADAKIRQAFGVDLSDEMIKEAEKLNKKYIDDGLVVLDKGNIVSLQYHDECFDKVFSVHTLYFWPDVIRGFSEIHRVLKPGGKLFLSIIEKSRMEKMKRTRNFNLITAAEIEALLEEQHFKISKVHQNGTLLCIEATK